MNYILFDNYRRELLPLTYTRPVSALRIGVSRIYEKWEYFLDKGMTFLSARYLCPKFPCQKAEKNLLINASVIPNLKLIEQLNELVEGQILMYQGEVVAFYATKEEAEKLHDKVDAMDKITLDDLEGRVKEVINEVVAIRTPADIFGHNGRIICEDIKNSAVQKADPKDYPTCTFLGDEIYIEPGATVLCATLNSLNGPIYIAAHSEVMEGSNIRGPFALNEYGIVKMGSTIYGDTTIGPHCKVGGEVGNSIFMAYTNKGHTGFVGNSVIGEWCNLGAGTNTSNLKNNYGAVKVWSYAAEKMTETGKQFHGLIMGDHSKASINSMFNTGSVAGVCANIFGAGFPPKHIPSFSWGGSGGFETFLFEKACEMAQVMCSRRKVPFLQVDRDILKVVFDESEKYRKS